MLGLFSALILLAKVAIVVGLIAAFVFLIRRALQWAGNRDGWETTTKVDRRGNIEVGLEFNGKWISIAQLTSQTLADDPEALYLAQAKADEAAARMNVRN